ncbi:MAG TPA: hypothetical protein VKK79_19520 [Candidatus Lokiarchaeia archaeon]|nr:hypothetical protein [Candidatus Lokiarchaeia archaeon]
MSYLVMVFAKEIQIFPFETEEEAQVHVEEWWASFPEIKAILVKVLGENIVEGDIKNEEAEDEPADFARNSGDLDLLACFEHLLTEGGPDNFLEACRGGIAMDFSAGKGDAEIEWVLLRDECCPNPNWGFEEGTSLEERGFEHKTKNQVDAYQKRVPANNMTDCMAIVHEACDILQRIFRVPTDVNWHLELNLQYI